MKEEVEPFGSLLLTTLNCSSQLKVRWRWVRWALLKLSTAIV